MQIPPLIGEPYALGGRRIVFTNWHYVRPAYAWWYDRQGSMLDKWSSAGPWEAEFQHRDCPWGIRLVTREAQRRGPLLRRERPWETRGVVFHTVLADGGLFRAWASGQSESGEWWPCTLESKDGLAWERPAAGLVNYEGSRDNNLCDIGFNAALLGAHVFMDPSAPASERYKCVTGKDFGADDAQRYALGGAVSPDGLHWTQCAEPLLVDECTDTQNVAYYDESLRKYVLYTRTRAAGQRSPLAPDIPVMGEGVARRAIGRTESEDFHDFPMSETVFEPGADFAPSDTLYTNCRTAVPGAPDHHLMFPTIWHQGDDTTSVALSSSWNGRLWQSIPGPRVLETRAFGQWDGGCLFAHPELVELPGGDFALPYTGFNIPHKYPRGGWAFLPGLAVWPKGRIVALEARERGEFTTIGLMAPGRKLRINAITKRAGGILIEVAGMDGTPVQGRTFAEAIPVIGDHHWSLVTWKGGDDLGFGENAAIILRFRLDKAELYGLQFED